MDEDSWPKKYKLYAHGSKETNRMLGEYLGMEDEACRLFKHALTEIILYASINGDGTYKVDGIKVDGDLHGLRGLPLDVKEYQEYHG